MSISPKTLDDNGFVRHILQQPIRSKFRAIIITRAGGKTTGDKNNQNKLLHNKNSLSFSNI